MTLERIDFTDFTESIFYITRYRRGQQQQRPVPTASRADAPRPLVVVGSLRGVGRARRRLAALRRRRGHARRRGGSAQTERGR